jgi:hypothetical protein
MATLHLPTFAAIDKLIFTSLNEGVGCRVLLLPLRELQSKFPEKSGSLVSDATLL